MDKWEAWLKIISNTEHFESFSVIFVCFLPLLVGFCNTFQFFSRFCLFFSNLSSHLSISRTVWQDRLAGQLGTAAWQNTWPPGRKKFWQEGIEFWQDEVVGPPSKMTQIRLCTPS